jgi:hypothetical protein
MKAPYLQVVMQPFNAPVGAAKVAVKILEYTYCIKNPDEDELLNIFY